MKTVIKALLAASMLMPIAAQAQDQDGRDRGPGRRGGEWGQRAPRAERTAEVGVDAQVRTERPQRGDMRPEGAQSRPDAGPGGRTDVQPQPDRRGQAGNWQDGRRDDRGGWQDGRRAERPGAGGDWRQPGGGQGRDAWRGNDGRPGYDNRGWTDDRGRDDRRGGAWNRGWRNDGRYDWNRNRQLHRGAYRLPRYYAPSGWGYGYRRYSVGVALSSILFDRNYWIDDPYTYRLPEAYGPYRWVRYYDDALLVDIRSGLVVDTVYGIFY